MGVQEIKLNTIGLINAGKYAGWYLIVIPTPLPAYSSAYTIHICNDTSFAFNPDERECYDEWVQDKLNLDGYFEDKDLGVQWDTSIAPPTFGAPSPEIKRLLEKQRSRMGMGEKATSGVFRRRDPNDDGTYNQARIDMVWLLDDQHISLAHLHLERVRPIPGKLGRWKTVSNTHVPIKLS